MDWPALLEELSGLVLTNVCGAAVWPVVVLVIFLMVRNPLLRLIPSLRQLNVKGIEMSFEERLESIESRARAEISEARQQPEGVQPDASPDRALDDIQHMLVSGQERMPRDYSLTGRHPRDVIIRGWQLLEDRIYEAASLLREYEDNPWNIPYMTVTQALYLLRGKNRISGSTSEVLLSLMQLRDDVVRDCSPVSREAAERYLSAVRSLQTGVFYSLIKSLHFGMAYRDMDKREAKNP